MEDRMFTRSIHISVAVPRDWIEPPDEEGDWQYVQETIIGILRRAKLDWDFEFVEWLDLPEVEDILRPWKRLKGGSNG